MAREGVTEDQLTRGEASADLNNVVYAVASTAKVSLKVRQASALSCSLHIEAC